MTSTQQRLTSEGDHEFYSQSLRVLVGLEVVLQATVFTILIILHVHPFVAISICAILFIACRLAARVCKSRLQQLNIHNS